VGPHSCEVELLRASAHQELGRPPRGGPQERERCWCENIEVRPAEDKRVARRHHFDDLGVRPSHAPLTEARRYFEDIRLRLEAVL
jgi:hypothetical protein